MDNYTIATHPSFPLENSLFPLLELLGAQFGFHFAIQEVDQPEGLEFPPDIQVEVVAVAVYFAYSQEISDFFQQIAIFIDEKKRRIVVSIVLYPEFRFSLVFDYIHSKTAITLDETDCPPDIKIRFIAIHIYSYIFIVS
jgi:hypothetical protein